MRTGPSRHRTGVGIKQVKAKPQLIRVSAISTKTRKDKHHQVQEIYEYEKHP